MGLGRFLSVFTMPRLRNEKSSKEADGLEKQMTDDWLDRSILLRALCKQIQLDLFPKPIFA